MSGFVWFNNIINVVDETKICVKKKKSFHETQVAEMELKFKYCSDSRILIVLQYSSNMKHKGAVI